MSETLIEYTKFDPSELASQLLLSVKQNEVQLADRHLLGVVKRYGSGTDLNQAVTTVQKGAADHAEGTSQHYAIVSEAGNVVGAASLYPKLGLAKQGLPLAPRLVPDYLRRPVVDLGPNISAWTVKDEEAALVGAYRKLGRMSFEGEEPHAAPWTIEPRRSPSFIHAAIEMAGLIKEGSGYYDDRESRRHAPPFSNLYIATDALRLEPKDWDTPPNPAAEPKPRARLVTPEEIGINFTQRLQAIAMRAWAHSLRDGRSLEEIKRAFDPNNPILVAEAQEKYQQFARFGRLAVVSETEFGPIVGFAMARNDVSPKDPDAVSLAIRSFKRGLSFAHIHVHQAFPDKVYAWIHHVSVEPEAGRGLGALAVKTVLEAFRADQKTTAYIDKENKRSQHFFVDKLGFSKDASYKKSVPRFGAQYPSTIQERYTARVGKVIEAAESIPKS